ncbi:hypothetical protein DPMN_076713 [Dreissena polymorpha]|uniref:Uncharacterized protein n=1 Tax=Dreissena polymorpha TaxID=45954 RepID=A0A9D3YMV4_DREPO|nr:hypothetical protein DPMN_076713 [Dreissena polymorpha]
MLELLPSESVHGLEDGLDTSKPSSSGIDNAAQHFSRTSLGLKSNFVGVKLGNHPSRVLRKYSMSKQHEQAVAKYFGPSVSVPSIADMLRRSDKTSTEEESRKYMTILFQSAFYMNRKNWALSDNLDDFILNFLMNDLQIQFVCDFLKINPNVK